MCRLTNKIHTLRCNDEKDDDDFDKECFERYRVVFENDDEVSGLLLISPYLQDIHHTMKKCLHISVRS